MQIQGNVFIVTGGSSGLGAACGRMLVEQGAKLIIADLKAAEGRALIDELGAQAQFQRTDVTNEGDVQQVVEMAQAAGRLAGAINCAGIAIAAKVLGKENKPHDLGQFRKVLEVNVVGSFNVIRLVSAALAQNEATESGERGVIINTASVAAFEGQIGQAAYSASKGAIVGMALPIAREMARYGVRIMTIAPGIFDTPMLASSSEAVRLSLGQQVPFPPRLGRPDEYAALARHIIENEMLNGEVIRLDGAIRMAPK